MRASRVYDIEQGDTMIGINEITKAHRGRIFEVRNPNTGEGIRGELVDAEIYLLNDVAVIRFKGEKLGIVGQPADRILLKSEAFVETLTPETIDSDTPAD